MAGGGRKGWAFHSPLTEPYKLAASSSSRYGCTPNVSGARLRGEGNLLTDMGPDQLSQLKKAMQVIHGDADNGKELLVLPLIPESSGLGLQCFGQ